MDISEYLQPTMALVGTTAGAFGLWHANRTNARMTAQNEQRDDVRAEAELADARWQAMLEHQRTHFEALLAPMSSRLEHLESKVQTLELAYETLHARHRVAIDHIRAVHRWADGERTDPIPGIPDPIINEV